MASFENTVVIRRPVDDVFAFLADFENVPRWNYAIVETRKVSPGPVGVGTAYRQTRSVPRRSEEGFQVTVFEPASQLEVLGEIGPFGARVRYLLEPYAADLGTSSLEMGLFWCPIAQASKAAHSNLRLRTVARVSDSQRGEVASRSRSA